MTAIDRRTMFRAALASLAGLGAQAFGNGAKSLGEEKLSPEEQARRITAEFDRLLTERRSTLFTAPIPRAEAERWIYDDVDDDLADTTVERELIRGQAIYYCHTCQVAFTPAEDDIHERCGSDKDVASYRPPTPSHGQERGG